MAVQLRFHGRKKEKIPHKGTKNSKNSQRGRFFVTSLCPSCLCEELLFVSMATISSRCADAERGYCPHNFGVPA